jgi:restriction system protein
MPEPKSAVSEVLAAAARVPWWLAALAAPVAFFGLRVLGSWPQFVVPPLLLLLAGLSLADRFRRDHKLASASREAENKLRGMSWPEFDRLLGQLLRDRGLAFLAELGGRPEGADVVAKKDEKRHLVQFKHWRAKAVDLNALRELFGVVVDKRMASGIVVTSGKFSPEAREFATGRNLELIDGYQITLWMRRFTQEIDPAAAASGSSGTAPRDGTDVVTMGNEKSTCPECASPMAVKMQRAGLTAGQKFWVCSRYPECRGTRPYGDESSADELDRDL